MCVYIYVYMHLHICIHIFTHMLELNKTPSSRGLSLRAMRWLQLVSLFKL